MSTNAKSATLTLETVQLADLKDHPSNPRIYPSEGSPEWESLKTSLASDYFDPIVWNKRNGLLVSGHLRTRVLKSLGFESAHAVVVDWSDEVHAARLVAANQHHGDWDDFRLKSLLQGLGEERPLAGMTDTELQALLADSATTPPTPPENFPQFTRDVKVDYKCPSCGFQWSGKPS